jgi:hypothetical protein
VVPESGLQRTAECWFVAVKEEGQDLEVERGQLLKKQVRNFEEERQQQQERREMLVDTFRVDSPFVTYTEETIESKYEYKTTDMVHEVTKEGKYEWIARPKSVTYQFSTKRALPKLGYGSSSSVTSEFFFPVGLGIRQNAGGKCVRKMLRDLLACLLTIFELRFHM